MSGIYLMLVANGTGARKLVKILKVDDHVQSLHS